MGFDDTPLASAVIPELTTVSQNTYQLGKQAVDVLHELINQGKPKKQIVLQPELIVRQVQDLLQDKGACNMEKKALTFPRRVKYNECVNETPFIKWNGFYVSA